jgi:hypothetical protein
MRRPLQFRRRFPALILFLISIFSGAFALPFDLRFSVVLSPFQKQYFPTYTATAMTGGTTISMPVWWIWKTAPERKPQLAHNADVVSATNPSHRELSLKVSP